ncbi:hypothetical protein [Paenibacillus illinoisensis]|uniref:hypothetical protein n=1 Tax=Paenibacillus illinoisensis TaxID=59845 RepID=UPI003018DAB3
MKLLNSNKTSLEKGIRYIAPVTVMLLALLGGCDAPPATNVSETNNITSEQADDIHLFSDDRKVSVTVPADWTTFSSDKIPAILSVVNKQGDYNFVVQRNSQVDMVSEITLKEYALVAPNGISFGNEVMLDAKDSNTTTTIDSEESYMSEGSMTYDGMATNYISASFKKEDHYYRALLIIQHELTEEDRVLFHQLASSLHVVDNQLESDRIASHSSTQVVKDIDKEVELQIPSSWITKFKQNKETNIKAADPTGNELVTLTRYRKSDFGDSSPPLDFMADAHIEYISKNFKDVKQLNSNEEEIDGRKVIQYEFVATVGKSNLGFLISVFDYPENFTIIEFIAPASTFEQTKEAYRNHIKSYHENP